MTVQDHVEDGGAASLSAPARLGESPESEPSPRSRSVAPLVHPADLARAAGVVVWTLFLRTGRIVLTAAEGLGPDLQAHELPGSLDELWEVVHPEDLPLCRAMLEAMLAGGDGVNGDVRIRSRSGVWVWTHIRGGVVERDALGRATSVGGLAANVTERKRAEETASQLVERAREAEKLESLAILASGVAHDVNDTLQGIMGNASLAKRLLPEDAPPRELLARIESSVGEAAQLADQMLALAGRRLLRKGPIDLAALLADHAPLLQSMLPPQVRLTVDVEPALPAVEGDELQLRQALSALVANAGEAIFEPVGEVSIRVRRGSGRSASSGERLVPAPVEGPVVCLEVADTGCGMDEATLARIFDPFFTTKMAGHGLGLPALLGIMRAHGAAIAVESEPNRGARVRLFLPILDGGARAGAGPRGADGPESGVILVADDQDYVREVVATMLQSEGYSVLQAEDGLQAVQLVRDRPGRVALALVDYMMPRMNGLEAAAEMRRLEPEMPVILSSGFCEPEAVGDALGNEICAFLHKPYRLAELAATIARVLESRGVASS